jgi:hypothetical protein
MYSTADTPHAFIDRRRPVFTHIRDNGVLAWLQSPSGFKLDLALYASAVGIGNKSGRATYGSSDGSAPTGANGGARRSGQSTQQSADAGAERCRERRIRLVDNDHKKAKAITMDHGSSMYRDGAFPVELPEFVLTLVGLAGGFEDSCYEIAHGSLL